jgi:hypothetical protein
MNTMTNTRYSSPYQTINTLLAIAIFVGVIIACTQSPSNTAELGSQSVASTSQVITRTAS